MTSQRQPLTAQKLREILNYSPETGEFTWIKRKHRRKLKAGGISAHRSGRKAHRICIDYRQYYANVLAWLWMTGEWPDKEVDHINTDSTDNRWINLRLATRVENNYNRGFGGRKFLGASFHKPSGLWQATVKKRHIGYFRTAEEAHEAYKREALRLYGEFAHSTISSGRWSGSKGLPSSDSLKNHARRRFAANKVKSSET